MFYAINALILIATFATAGYFMYQWDKEDAKTIADRKTKSEFSKK